MMSATTALFQPYPTMSDGADDRADGPVQATDVPLSAESSFDLVLRANRGEAPALDALLARYLPRLQRWAHGRLPPAARGALQTQDLVQDTLMHVIQRLPSFNPRHEGAFQGYVRTTLWNRIRDLARHHSRTGPAVPLDTDIAAEEWSPLDLAVGRETLDRYEAALERLRPDDKALIVARIEMGLPYPEMAAMFEKPSVAAVHMAVSRALVKLAEEMAHERKR
jgi:RNA polymerase sigma-70 factor (ECF subfamily)